MDTITHTEMARGAEEINVHRPGPGENLAKPADMVRCRLTWGLSPARLLQVAFYIKLEPDR